MQLMIVVIGKMLFLLSVFFLQSLLEHGENNLARVG